MVQLDLKTKQLIVELKYKGLKNKDIATRIGKSTSTIGRVLKEHDEGLFPTPTTRNGKEHKPRLTSFGVNLEELLNEAGAPREPHVCEELTPIEPPAPHINDQVDKMIDEAISDLGYVITPMNVCFTYLGKDYTADATSTNYSDIIQALLNADGAKAVELLDIATAIEVYMQGHVVVKGGVVYYKTIECTGGMTKRIIEAMKTGDKKHVRKLVNFFIHLMENPSMCAVQELFGFLEANDIEITDDGYFLAYKKVNSKFHDIYTGKMDNSVGTRVEMPRNMVDEDSTQTCSAGLHVCSKSYLPHYGGSTNEKIVMCAVHPKDVVAVPKDYKNAKMRCAAYTVVMDVTDKMKGQF